VGDSLSARQQEFHDAVFPIFPNKYLQFPSTGIDSKQIKGIFKAYPFTTEHTMSDMNLLKAAVDPNSPRNVSWTSHNRIDESRLLRAKQKRERKAMLRLLLSLS
jgi:hypothetical protein